MDIDGSIADIHTLRPDPPEDLIARKNLAGREHQKSEQPNV
jgi:hypothetical protein